ncbi:MAG: class I SAM-dependent methyltransferase [Phaeodactylibacter sp.]|nr:class I SAM-dependent methyltransferase [Phaeodactylibacter sp.]
MQEQAIRDFFNDIAADYPNRYDPKNVFLHFLHTERLVYATQGLELNQARMLDIGAGTGQLYDLLARRSDPSNYLACDIAENMRLNSRVPEDQYRIGKITELELEPASFDLIFMLGVTSYLSRASWQADLQRIYELLKPGGIYIVTCTHAASLDYRIRHAAQRLLPKKWLHKRLVGQGFQTTAYTPEEARQLLEPYFDIQEFCWLNQTVSPFNRIFPRWSLRLAHPERKKSKLNYRNRLLSGDFLFRAEKL